jgi:hypothetical protein
MRSLEEAGQDDRGAPVSPLGPANVGRRTLSGGDDIVQVTPRRALDPVQEFASARDAPPALDVTGPGLYRWRNPDSLRHQAAYEPRTAFGGSHTHRPGLRPGHADPARPLPPHPDDRRRRDGGGLAGRADEAAAAAGGAQDPQAGDGLPDGHRPLRAGAPGAGADGSPECRQGVSTRGRLPKAARTS